MTTDAYEQALNKAKADLISAIRNRDHWTMEIVRLQNVVSALSQMSAKHSRDATDSADEIGLQEVVYTCIRMSKIPITPTRIKSELESVGYDLKKYSNAMAVIHSALKRLKDAGKVRETDGMYSAVRMTLGQRIAARD
jgi:hypothetical protein